ncbi:hypothetical protein BL250_08555 [Erwinia sp. OLTSP20]|uniref:lysine exporter LysO family protein n=1 Tax=unclassified Erwinia TaxID=2622719 RepID=UPI000C195040|nr:MULTISPECIES: lysine exporter LysO family protein [unclassified Erwinia]PIJ51294.1 hypothetical protein BV501_04485 [Erwinia sp. OAMSP11]PIJ74079.1 hypothetical protein BK416_04775 [Erwinia sp. OLSSP12]PIJ81185.1 hypothetical protein BLD47_09620 [Erwinia sp. OLCASP19]PIJ86042.1 hypothetical protein BLD46_04570 [Erwinia sp. OLMTSP26]PIJ87791.1 hypothetical protein BLD49_04570 [Erwinia sp. OLMDSP33]
MYSGLLIILLPLIIGYLLPLIWRPLLIAINKLLSAMVYIILFFMGISLAFLENLGSNLLNIARISLISALCIILCNLIGLLLLARRYPWQHRHHQQALPSRLQMALESLKLGLVVLAGFISGLSHWSPLRHASEASEYALLLLLFLVGLQLRGSGMTLRQIVLNRRGMMIACIVWITSLAGGAVASLLTGVPLNTGLALGSGFGWYSLSGILMTESFGPMIGSAAFFNDLLRELLAITLIPALILRHRTSALGLCGATSMDFTLPVLQRSGGNEIVPAAIVHGFLLSLLAPVMMALFSA